MTTFILAVDHRNSLRRWLDSLGVPAAEIDPTAKHLKRLCVTALQRARADLGANERPMLLLDEEYGVEAIPAAKEHALPVVIPAERSGQAEFQFEHGDGFREAIELADPDAVKALVRYNVAGDAGLNSRQRERLIQLQSYLHDSGRTFMLEVLVPPTTEQAAAHGERFDEDLRPELTVAAIDELAAAGMRPDWWKLEGNNDRAAAASVASAGSATAELGCLVLGRGQDRVSVVHWVQVAASVDGFVGFAVGRTLWTDAFAALVRQEIEEDAVVDRIATAYLDIATTYRQTAAVVAGVTDPRAPERDQ
jgi:myo-inositol catabolism protein IolC